jgi:hypothetical protein
MSGTPVPKPKQSPNPLAVGPNAGAQLAGVSRSRFFELLAADEIPSRKDGRRRLILVIDIKKWLSRRPVSPLPKRENPPTGPLLPADLQKGAAAQATIEPEFDWAALYRQRVQLLMPDVGQNEAEARAYDFAVGICRARTRLDLEAAKKVILTAIGKAAP